jgi:hypothetical protein
MLFWAIDAENKPSAGFAKGLGGKEEYKYN